MTRCYSTTFLCFALAFAATLLPAEASTSLRGRTNNDRIMYSTQFGGIQGLQAVVAGGGLVDEKTHHHTQTTDEDADLLDQQVFFEPQPGALYERPENDYDTRIVGGYGSLQQKSYAMHLRYQSSDNSWHYAGCGGTLISNCHVLTAAHCVANGRAGLPDGVYINAYKPFQGNANAPFHFSEVSKIHIHPQFNDDNNINDVAVITMSTCANTDNFPIMRVATPEYMQGVRDGDEVSVSGFGRLAAGDSSLVDQLQRVEVDFISTASCNKDFYKDRIEDDMICAGVQNGGKDSCQGDSGGPLFMDQNDGTQVQIGVVSWGSGCAIASKPGVYSSMAFHFDFIQAEVCSYYQTDLDIELCDGLGLRTIRTDEPTLFPTTEPNTCGALNDSCYSSLDCCSPFTCQPRDRVCKIPSGGGNTGKQSVNRKRRNGKY